MIKYKLLCKSCKLKFDSWFASSDEYEKLKKKNFLNCHQCNSSEIEKTLMAPKLINNSKIKNPEKNFKKLDNVNKTIRQYQKFIKDNFEYVGKNFAYEARSIHYNEKKTKKGIYGTASNEEMKELRDEGVEVEIIPWLENKNN